MKRCANRIDASRSRSQSKGLSVRDLLEPSSELVQGSVQAIPARLL